MLWLPPVLLLLLGANLWIAEARWTQRPRRTTPTTPTTTTSTTLKPDRHQYVHHWPPLLAPRPSQPATTTYAPELPASSESIRLLEGFDQRSANGEHEYRYKLSNGDTRYERTYWLPVGKNWVLARRGYYSIPMPNAQYSTVFYRADHQGYHVETHTLSGKQPLLPRSLEVPHDTVAAKRNSISVPERNVDVQKKSVDKNGTGTQTHSQTPIPSPNSTYTSGLTPSTTQTEGKVQAVVQIENSQSQSQSHRQKLKQNKTKPSTVAKVVDILATEVGIAPAVDVPHDDVQLDDHVTIADDVNDAAAAAAADDDDDDDYVTESEQNTRA